MGQMMQIEEEKEDPEKTEFEPIVSDNLQESILRRMLLAQKLGVYENEHLKTEEDIRVYAVSKGLLPKNSFGNCVWNNICSDSNVLANFIEKKYRPSEYEYGRRTIELKLKDWTLVGNIPLFVQNEISIHLIGTAGVDVHQYHFLAGYIQALALICESGLKNGPVPKIYVECYSKTTWQSKCIDITPKNAEMLLEKKKKKMFKVQMDETGKWGRYSKVLPIDMVLEGEIESYDDYIKAFKDERKSPWKFFAGKKLFDIKNVCGFTEKYFKELWDIEVNNLKELTPGLWNADKDMGGDVDVAE